MEKKKLVLYAYSIDEENFIGEYASKQEAIVEGFKEVEIGKNVYVGRIVSIELSDVDEERVIEQVVEDTITYNDIPDGLADDYMLNIPKRKLDILQKRLSNVFKNWAEEFKYEIDYYNVANVEKYKKQ